MPVTFEEVQQHKKFHGFDDLETTTAKKYRRLLSSDALFVVDHHDFLRSSLTGEIFATNREQVEAMIEYARHTDQSSGVVVISSPRGDVPGEGKNNLPLEEAGAVAAVTC